MKVLQRVWSVLCIVVFVSVCSLAYAEERNNVVFRIEYTLKMPDATRIGLYTGETLNGLPHGYGLFTTKNSSGIPWHYIGQWKNGSLCGYGGCYWDIGQAHVGQYVNNAMFKGVKTEETSDDFQSMSTSDLIGLKLLVSAELAGRNIDSSDVTVPMGTYIVGIDIPANTYTISPTSTTTFSEIKVYSANGERLEWHIVQPSDKIGKIILSNGQTVEIGYSSVVFSKYQGLGFD